ncbi:MAG: 3-demethylubiquinone-9 3-methyltransferase [Candidatus Moranbacteria bacterium GW2011_GWC2_37_8]|nr:MAG: 3-demethylubiquinone-9 3-methyltransferase [Candidatus Moranbacteria bacterium GW2011_GWC2_37_8]
MQKLTPFIWFNDGAEEAAEFYVSVFTKAGEKAGISGISHYPKVTEKVSGKPAGSVMTVAFNLAGQDFIAINGGEPFRLSEAFSLTINCDTQEEIDYYWETLKEGGDEKSQICGWLKDRFGLSWQIMPTFIEKMLQDQDKNKVERVMAAVLDMKKINMAQLQEAYEGKK